MNRHSGPPRWIGHTPNEEKLSLINHVLTHPDDYFHHDTLGLLAHKLVLKSITESFKAYELEDEPKHFDVFGNKHIEVGAIKQMEFVSEKVVLIGGSPEEAPIAYKDIELVMGKSVDTGEDRRSVRAAGSEDG